MKNFDDQINNNLISLLLLGHCYSNIHWEVLDSYIEKLSNNDEGVRNAVIRKVLDELIKFREENRWVDIHVENRRLKSRVRELELLLESYENPNNNGIMI